MAKKATIKTTETVKKQTKSNEKSVTFDDLKSELKKLTTLGGTLETNEFATIKYYVNSGNYGLNAVISGSLLKGFPGGRIIELAGEKQTGKTFCLMNAVKKAQDDGMLVLWYDTETAIDKETLAPSFGINLSDVWYEPMNIIEKIAKHMMQFLESILKKKRAGFSVPRILIVIDSLGNLASNKEHEDSLKDDIKVDMTRAKAISSLFRLIAIPLNELESTLIYSNHVYADTSSFVGGNIGKGGKSREYIASTLVQFYKSGGKDDGVTKNGVIVRAKTGQKNRFAIPGEMQFHIDYRKGMNPYIGLPFMGLPFKQDWFIDLEKEGWDLLGIQYGRIIDVIQMQQLAAKKGEKFSKEIEQLKNTSFEHNGELYYFASINIIRKLDMGGLSKVQIAVKHLCKEVELKDFYTDEVFTPEILKIIDDNIIIPRFSFGEGELSLVEELVQIDSAINEDEKNVDEELDAEIEQLGLEI